MPTSWNLKPEFGSIGRAVGSDNHAVCPLVGDVFNLSAAN